MMETDAPYKYEKYRRACRLSAPLISMKIKTTWLLYFDAPRNNAARAYYANDFRRRNNLRRAARTTVRAPRRPYPTSKTQIKRKTPVHRTGVSKMNCREQNHAQIKQKKFVNLFLGWAGGNYKSLCKQNHAFAQQDPICVCLRFRGKE